MKKHIMAILIGLFMLLTLIWEVPIAFGYKGTDPNTVATVNSEMANSQTLYGYRGAGRHQVTQCAYPSYNWPFGMDYDPHWANSLSAIAYEPGLGAPSSGNPGNDPDYIGPLNLYRQLETVHTGVTAPVAYWAHPNSSYKEPWITKVTFDDNIGLHWTVTTYAFSYDYNHTNDLIFVKYCLQNNGNMDPGIASAATAGKNVTPNHDLKAFCIGENYDFDISADLSPTALGMTVWSGGDDQTNYCWDSTNPGWGTGGGFMYDADDPAIPGNDAGIDSPSHNVWFGMWRGSADIACLQGWDPDLKTATDKRTIWGGPAVGMYSAFSWFIGGSQEPSTSKMWFDYAMSEYFKSYPGDSFVNQPLDMSPNPDYFDMTKSSGSDFTTWVAKSSVAGVKGLSANLKDFPDAYKLSTQIPPPAGYSGPAPNPWTGGDRKEIMQKDPGDNRMYFGWGPFSLKVGEALTLWKVDLQGVASEGAAQTIKRAREIWATYKAPSDPSGDGDFVGLQTPPPPPVVKVERTVTGTVKVKWNDVAEHPVKDAGQNVVTGALQGYKILKSFTYPAHDPQQPFVKVLPAAGQSIPGNLALWDWKVAQVPDSIKNTFSKLATTEAGGCWGPYYEIARLAPGDATYLNTDADASTYKYAYEDKSVIVGFKYWYSIAAYDNQTSVDSYRYPDGLESYYTMNFNGTDGTWQGEFPFQGEADPGGVGRIPGTSVIAAPDYAVNASTPGVSVVPNPYKGKATWDAGQGHTVQFRNIPVPCTIKIYDLNGKYINTITVPDSKGQKDVGGMVSWNLTNIDNIEVASGLYIYVIQSSTGSKTGTFVILR
jgi:hypothetical protein